MNAEALKALGSVNKDIDQDVFSEFSVLTAESEMTPQENILDLRLSEIEFNPLQINEILGMKDALPSAVQTFVTLDFFNHATKHTDLASGYKPEVNTVFSFKNAVDDFYLDYLKSEFILAEVYIVKAGGSSSKNTLKMGEAKLPLLPLL